MIVAPGHPSPAGRRCRCESWPTSASSASGDGARLRELLVGASRLNGFEPKVMLESNEAGRIRRLVSRGMGVAILPRSDADGPGADVAVLRLRSPSLSRDITLAWRDGRRHPPAVARFLTLCRDMFAIDREMSAS